MQCILYTVYTVYYTVLYCILYTIYTVYYTAYMSGNEVPQRKQETKVGWVKYFDAGYKRIAFLRGALSPSRYLL